MAEKAAAKRTMRLEVVTPREVVFAADADMIVAPATEGSLGILPLHAPLVSALDPGVLRVQQDGMEVKMAVSGGFIVVKPHKTVVLADTAERAENIDVERAMAARERAIKRLTSKGEGIDLIRAEAALRRATARLKAAGHGGGNGLH